MCCGQNRQKQRAATSSPVRPPGPPPAPTRVSFINQGTKPVTVRGPVTGVEYRFDRPGARVEVDARDRILLASLRQLRQIV
jgi:hypothetical protein